MRNVILMLLLAVMSNSAMAEWVKIGGGDNITSYAEPSTIRKSGNIVKMWSLDDFATVQSVLDSAFLSQKTQTEYDCNEVQARMVYYSWHSENMGGGSVIFSRSKQAEWRPVPPASVIEAMWKFACGKNEQAEAAKTPDRLANERPELNKSTAVVSNDSLEDWIKVSSTISTGKMGVKGKHGRILLSGEIRPGDAEIIASTLEKNVIVQLKLNSMGGDVAESMKIVSLIKGAHLNTTVAPRGFCASACFFLYLAGDSRVAYSANDDGTLPKIRQGANGGFVGIHRPYLKTPSGEGKQKDVMQRVRKYMDSEGVSQHLTDTMMTRPSNDIYWLSENDLESIGEFSAGQEEALISKCGYKRFSKQISEKWTEEQRDHLSDCENDYFFKTIDPEKQKFLTKLRTGWRPWQNKKL